jgi:hypothetical protein
MSTFRTLPHVVLLTCLATSLLMAIMPAEAPAKKPKQ